MSKHYAIDANGVTVSEKEDVFESPFENAFASPFDLEDYADDCVDEGDKDDFVTLSRLSSEKMHQRADAVLSLRDTVLRKSIFKGIGIIVDETEAALHDDSDEVSLFSDSDDCGLDECVSPVLEKHIGNRVWVKGFLAKFLLKHRLGASGARLSEFKIKRRKEKSCRMTTFDLLSHLQLYANNYAKAYAVANISEHILKYLNFFGRENCKVTGRIKGTQYEIVLTHTNYTESVVSEESKETVFVLPISVFKDLGVDWANKTHLDLRYYDTAVLDWKKAVQFKRVTRCGLLGKLLDAYWKGRQDSDIAPAFALVEGFFALLLFLLGSCTSTASLVYAAIGFVVLFSISVAQSLAARIRFY